MSEQDYEDLIEAMKQNERCPWNPFPRDSIWGRRLDRWWRSERERIMRRQESNSTQTARDDGST